MGSRDSWKDKIQCPKCSTIGTLSEWQEDGWSFQNNDDTNISSVTDGFKIVKDIYSRGERIPVKCIKCNVYV